MMFTPARFVVVDDKKHHLAAIVQVFQQLGSPCISVHYDPAHDPDPAIFRGVRCLFLDLHLLEGQAGTDNKRHYAVIAALLESVISPLGGPFILVLWTEHAHLGGELRTYLNDSLGDVHHARPFAVSTLAKESFINVDSGEMSNPDLLRGAVLGSLEGTPQLAALLSWEQDVMAAAGSTLVSLLSLVEPDQRRERYAEGLDAILSRLASEAVGRSQVEVDHRAAIMAALAPILSDRVLNQDPSDSAKALWRGAVTRYKTLKDATFVEAGAINRMLHLAMPSAETVRASDWGAVVNLPWSSDDEMLAHMGLNAANFFGGELLIEKADRARCKIVLVRIGAVCDYAQNRKGPIVYILGAEVPCDVKRKTRKGTSEELPLSTAIWRSPVLQTDNAPFRLNVHVRFPVTVLHDVCKAWSVRYRLREQLLMTLIVDSGNYASRPGIIQLPARNRDEDA